MRRQLPSILEEAENELTDLERETFADLYDQLAVFLGLIPRQHSRENKQQLLHGTRSALQVAHKKTDKKSRWAINLKARCGENKACIVLANKNVKIV